MNILSWILFGLIAGFIADALAPSQSPNGLLGTLILGILGSVVGGFLGSLIFGVDITGFNLTSFILAVAGALTILYVRNAVSRRV